MGGGQGVPWGLAGAVLSSRSEEFALKGFHSGEWWGQTGLQGGRVDGLAQKRIRRWWL